LIRDSGGAGRFRGGLGIRRKYVNLAEARFSIRSTKHVIPAEGYSDGLPGRTGDIRINPDSDNWKRLPTRCADYPLATGDIFELETPGGGGYGDPLARDPQAVLCDVQEGYVSAEAALRDYGVALVHGSEGWRIEAAATEQLRSAGQRQAGAA
jgi:N-methylhydantoinase B